MKEQDLFHLKNDFTEFFHQIHDLIIDNNTFKNIIEDYIDCKDTIGRLSKKTDKKSRKLLKDYLSIQKDLETEIYSHLDNKKIKIKNVK